MSVHSLDRFLNNVFDIYALPSYSSDLTYTKDEYYITTDDKQWTIEMATPGISKDNLKINIEDGMLTVEANSSIKSKAVRNIKKTWHVDDSIDISNITAKLDNGLLLITLPKVKPTKKTIAVTVS